MPKKPTQADPFDVWGWPPAVLLKGLSPKQTDTLRRYVLSITDKTYRLAYSNGLVEGFTKVSLAATLELKRHRKEMRRS